MAELKLELSYQEVTGYGLQYGFSQLITNMDHGPHLVRLILWNQEVTQAAAQLVV
jgi:hypothetical protein